MDERGRIPWIWPALAAFLIATAWAFANLDGGVPDEVDVDSPDGCWAGTALVGGVCRTAAAP